jgi:hypothetical protein
MQIQDGASANSSLVTIFRGIYYENYDVGVGEILNIDKLAEYEMWQICYQSHMFKIW